MTTANHKIIEDWFERVWNAGDETAIDRLMAPAATFHGLPTHDGAPIVGPAAFKPFALTFREAFPDIRISVLRTVCEGELVAAHCAVTGTHKGASLGVKATGLPIEISGMGMAVIRNGQIQESWNYFDFMSLYQQVGMLSQLPGKA